MAATSFWKGWPQHNTHNWRLQPPEIVQVSYLALFGGSGKPQTAQYKSNEWNPYSIPSNISQEDPEFTIHFERKILLYSY